MNFGGIAGLTEFHQRSLANFNFPIKVQSIVSLGEDQIQHDIVTGSFQREETKI